MVEFLLMEGRLDEAWALIEKLKPAQRALTPILLLEALHSLLKGNPPAAVEGFTTVLDRVSLGRRKAVHLPGLMDLFFILALVGKAGEPDLALAADRLELLGRRQPFGPAPGHARALHRCSCTAWACRPGPRPRPARRRTAWADRGSALRLPE